MKARSRARERGFFLIRCGKLFGCFQLQAAFVLFHEFLELLGVVEQADPLLVIERHRESAQAVHAYRAFFADAEVDDAALSTGLQLLLGSRQLRF